MLYFGSVLTSDGYCTKDIKMRIVIAKEAFNKKMPLFASKLDIESRKKLFKVLSLDHFFIWLADLYTKKIGVEVFVKLWNVVLEENGENKMIRKRMNKFLNI